jgi:hypothetical protein
VKRLLRIERLLPSESFRILALWAGSKQEGPMSVALKKISSIVDNRIWVLYL